MSSSSSSSSLPALDSVRFFCNRVTDDLFLCMERVDGRPERVAWWTDYGKQEISAEKTYKSAFFDYCYAEGRLLTKNDHFGRRLSLFYSNHKSFTVGLYSMLEMLESHSQNNHCWISFASAVAAGSPAEVRREDVIMSVTVTLAPDCAIAVHMGINRSLSFQLKQLRLPPSERHPSADFPVNLSVLVHCFAARTLLRLHGSPLYMFSVPVDAMTSILQKSFSGITGSGAWFQEHKDRLYAMRDDAKAQVEALPRIVDLRKQANAARAEADDADCDPAVDEETLAALNRKAESSRRLLNKEIDREADKVGQLDDELAERRWRASDDTSDNVFFSVGGALVIRDPRKRDVFLFEANRRPAVDRPCKVNGRTVQNKEAYAYVTSRDIFPYYGQSVLIAYDSMTAFIDKLLSV